MPSVSASSLDRMAGTTGDVMVINQHHLMRNYRPIKDMLDRKVKEHGVSYGLSEAGYDIRIKQSIHFFNDDGVRRVGVMHPDGPDFEEGRFVIASTIEEFDMPGNLVGIVHDKSTWARRGLSVFNTVIEPKWKGWLTLELVYHGNDNLVIPAGAGIAQVIFHELVEPAEYSGKYNNQPDHPVAARES